MPYPINQYSAEVPNTFLLDAAQLQKTDLNSEEFRQLLVKLYQSLNKMALVVNKKTTGFRLPSESNTGKVFFANPEPDPGNTNQVVHYRNSYGVSFDYGALPNSSSSARPHGIIDLDSTTTGVNIYAVATNPTTVEFLKIPYVSTVGDHIQIDVDDTNVTITTMSDRTAYTRTVVFIEYLRN